MSEQAHLVLGVIVGACVLGFLVVATIALCLGRALRAQGRARFGELHEVSLAVEVPEARQQRESRDRAMLSPGLPPDG